MDNYIIYTAIIVLYLTNIILISNLIKQELLIKSPFIALWFTILVIILLPSIMDIFITEVDPHYYANVIILDKYLLFEFQCYVFAVLICFNVFINPLSSSNKICYLKETTEATDQRINNIFFILILLGFAYPLYELYTKFGFNLLSSFSFVDRRENTSAVSKFILTYNMTLFAGYSVWLGINKKYQYFIAIFIFYLFIFLFLGGSRQQLLTIIIPYFFISNMKLNKKLSFYITVAIICSYSLGSLKVLLYLRNLNSFTDRIDAILNISDTIGAALANSSGEENLRYAFYYFLSDNSINTDFFQLKYFFRTLLFWLPSFLDVFNIKPSDFEYVMFSNYMNGEIGSMHPTLFGTLYADSGILIIPWILLIVAFRYLYLKTLINLDIFSNNVLWVILSFSGLMIARGAIYGQIVVCFYSILMLCILSIIRKMLRNRNNVNNP